MIDDTDQFLAELFREDELGLIVRATIRIEAKMILFINGAVARPELVPDLELHDRVKLCLALGMDETLKSSLNALANIRNKFAHRIDAKISKVEINNFYDTLPGDYKAAHQGMIKSTKVEEHTELNLFRAMLAVLYIAVSKEVKVQNLVFVPDSRLNR